MGQKRSILIIAGEVSGDMHAANMIRRVRADAAASGGEIRFWGIGGDEMAAEGVELLYHVRDMAVLGLSEVLRRYFFFRRVFHHMLEQMDADPPDALLLVDYPGFNLRFAKQAKKRGHNVLYYISPQVWAWKASRIPQMAKYIDRLMVILPFEVDVFKGHDLQVDFVGHPLVEETANALNAPETALAWGQGDGLKIALLPGSRTQEIERILPVLLEVVQGLDGVRPLIGAVSDEAVPLLKSIAPDIPIAVGKAREIMRQADFGLVASGTATLEAALMECPHVVVYRTAAFTWWVGSRVVKLPFIGLVNIVANRELSKEFLQDEANPDAIRRFLRPIFCDSAKLRLMKGELKSVRTMLDVGGDRSKIEGIICNEVF